MARKYLIAAACAASLLGPATSFAKLAWHCAMACNLYAPSCEPGTNGGWGPAGPA